MVDPREFHEKLTRIRNLLTGERMAGIALARAENVAWITCGGDAHVWLTKDTSAGVVLITASRIYLICSNVERPRLVEEELSELQIDVMDYPWHKERLGSILRTLAPGGTVGADIRIMGFTDITKVFDPLRWRLTEWEVERYRALGRDTAWALGEALREAAPGMTEHEVAGAIGGRLLRKGIVPAFLMVGSDDRAVKYRHAIPTEKTIDRYCVAVVMGRRHGLHASCTRAVHFGEMPEELVHQQETVRKIDATLIHATRPGGRMMQMFQNAVAQYREAGFPKEWEGHHLGGLTGYEPRYYLAEPDHDHQIRANQAVAWNPTLGGARSEDTILATEGDPVILTDDPEWPSSPVAVEGAQIPRPEVLIR